MTDVTLDRIDQKIDDLINRVDRIDDKVSKTNGSVANAHLSIAKNKIRIDNIEKEKKDITAWIQWIPSLIVAIIGIILFFMKNV